MSAFPTTRWTLILGAQRSPEAAAQAWRHLLKTYWPPLYAFFRAKGLDPTAAADAVQGLCVELLERDAVHRLTPDRGRLRGFLKVCAENFLIRQHEKATAAKRGGADRPVELDALLGERLADPALGPDVAYERAWALAVFERALATLERDWGTRAGSFEVIKLFFAPGATPPGYREVAQQYGLSIPQLKSLLHRARASFKTIVEEQVQDTVGTEADVQAELGSLLEALSR